MSSPSLQTMHLRLATDLGWIRGTLTMPTDQSLERTLNGQDGLMRLSDVVVPSRKERLDFLAVRTRVVSLVLPEADPVTAHASRRVSNIAASHRERSVLAMLAKVSVNGKVRLHNHARVSDVFASGQQFFRFTAASIFADRGPGQSDLLDTVDEVYVNLDKILGISDLDGSPTAPPPRVVPASPEALAAIRRRHRHMPSS